MQNLELTIINDILKTDHKWLSRDFKKNEKVYLYNDNTYGCISKKGIPCTLNGTTPFFELPYTAVSIKYENKDYGIFMIEYSMGYLSFYCKAIPFDRKELLSKIQSNGHVKEEHNISSTANASSILKVSIKMDKISFETIELETIAPLF